MAKVCPIHPCRFLASYMRCSHRLPHPSSGRVVGCSQKVDEKGQLQKEGKDRRQCGNEFLVDEILWRLFSFSLCHFRENCIVWRFFHCCKNFCKLLLVCLPNTLFFRPNHNVLHLILLKKTFFTGMLEHFDNIFFNRLVVVALAPKPAPVCHKRLSTSQVVQPMVVFVACKPVSLDWGILLYPLC